MSTLAFIRTRLANLTILAEKSHRAPTKVDLKKLMDHIQAIHDYLSQPMLGEFEVHEPTNFLDLISSLTTASIENKTLRMAMTTKQELFNNGSSMEKFRAISVELDKPMAEFASSHDMTCRPVSIECHKTGDGRIAYGWILEPLHKHCHYLVFDIQCEGEEPAYYHKVFVFSGSYDNKMDHMTKDEIPLLIVEIKG